MIQTQSGMLRQSSAVAAAAGGLGVLTTHTDAPVVTETTVEADLLHPLHVLTHGGVKEIRVLLGGLAILHVALPIQHEGWDLELEGVADDRHNLIDLVSCQLTCALVHVNVTLLADDVR